MDQTSGQLPYLCIARVSHGPGPLRGIEGYLPEARLDRLCACPLAHLSRPSPRGSVVHARGCLSGQVASLWGCVCYGV